MGKGATLTTDGLLLRAELALRNTEEFGRRFLALRELRALERDFRRVTSKLAGTMRVPVPYSGDDLRRILTEAEEILLS